MTCMMTAMIDENSIEMGENANANARWPWRGGEWRGARFPTCVAVVLSESERPSVCCVYYGVGVSCP